MKSTLSAHILCTMVLIKIHNNGVNKTNRSVGTPVG